MNLRLPVLALTGLLIFSLGIDETLKVTIITIAVVFPIYINTFAAIRGVDSRLVESSATFGLNRLGLVRHVILPGALPGARRRDRSQAGEHPRARDGG